MDNPHHVNRWYWSKLLALKVSISTIRGVGESAHGSWAPDLNCGSADTEVAAQAESTVIPVTRSSHSFEARSVTAGGFVISASLLIQTLFQELPIF